MPQIQATVPVLVQQIQVEKNLEYKLSPVFFSYPEVYHRRYEQAVSRFGREVREHFKNFEINRHNSSELLWYMFAPPLKHKIVQMEFMAGKQLISGQFSVVYFNLQGKTFVCLPGFSAFVFLADSSNPTEIFAQARTVIEKLLREYKKRDNETTWDMTPHYAIKNEFVTTLEFNIQVGDSKFGFEKSESSDFFAFFGGLSTFDGATEISKVGQNLNEVPMGELKRAFFREDLLEQLQPIYNQTENTPLALVGAEGVGKHSLIHELVARYRTQMSEKETPNDTWTQIWHIDPTRIIAGMSIVGMWQRRLEAILTHIQTRISEACKVYNMPATDRKDKILIDNPVALLRIGKSAQNSMTLSDVLKPYLEKRSFQIILLASPEEWKLIQEKDRRLADLFQVIRVPEPPYEVAVKMMLQQRKVLEITHNCTINIPAVRQLFNIHKYYFKRRALPGSVARMLSQLSVKYANQTIDSEEVQNEFREYSGLNVQMLDDNFVLEKNVLERQLSEKLIGQAAAVETLANVVHTIKSKLANPNRPLGSFLFIGPTGVGKTEAAKLVCERILGGADKLMRFDMNEYIDEWSVSRLIGDYYNPEGQLTGKIRYNPFGVLLFDEIEKAHPKIHDLLLQVLDDGRLTDSIGRTVDFTNTIIIMTSNIGAQQVSHQLGFESEARQDTAIYYKAVENFFRPEFINRIDKIVIFNNLQLEHILEIAKLQINNLLSRDGFVRRTTILNISNEALDWVAKRGYNSRMGGRSLKRQIEKDLTVFTADQLVQTGADQPIIFDIQIKDNQLCPRIEALKFAQPLPDGWLPLLPNEKEAQSAYRELFRQVERLEKQVAQSQTQINDKNNGVKTDWQFYDYTNQIAEKKEKLNRLLMGFRSSYIDNIPSNLLRLKGSSASSVIYNNGGSKRASDNRRSIEKLEKILISDKLFQQSALEEISFGYQHAPEQFDKSQGLYLSDFMDIALMQKIAPFAQRRQLQHLFLRVRSAIDNTGKEEMEFLLGVYKEVLESLSVGVTVDEKNACLELNGYAIQELLDKEQGYHFFYRSRQNPLPIRVWLAPDASTNPPTDTVPEVVRLYDIWMGKNHKSSTITDLRTGFTNQADIDPQEFKMFLFAK